MTTIVYHNNILAADSRSTRVGHDDCTCRHCGEKAALVKEDRTKIQLINNGCLFMGERILAMAASGTVTDIDRQAAAMKTVSDYHDALEHFYAISYSATCLRCTVMLVTECSVFVVNVDNPKKNDDGKYTVTYTQYQRLTDTAAIGTGKMAALTAIRVYDETALEAINVAATIDDHTGGNKISYVDFTAKELEVASMELKPREVIVPRRHKGRRVSSKKVSR